MLRVQGHLDPSWTEWLGVVELTHESGGDSRLKATIPDQAALHGLLEKIRDMGLTLLAVKRDLHDAAEFEDGDERG